MTSISRQIEQIDFRLYELFLGKGHFRLPNGGCGILQLQCLKPFRWIDREVVSYSGIVSEVNPKSPQ
jgi:hypothetical protein